MTSLRDFIKINEFEWEIPASFRADMQTSVHFFASKEILESALADKTIDQAINVSTMPGLVGKVMVMPDMHQGYGFPIGGVAAFSYPDGVISPGGIGYDINCGVRLLTSTIEVKQAEPYLSELAGVLNQNCPSGLGTSGSRKLSKADLDKVCRLGSKWAVQQGAGNAQDLVRTEEGGCIEGADPARVSNQAKERGSSQLGTLGSGNHFIEIDYVDQVFDLPAANAMGLFQGCLTVQIHCGSRGFGHQICTDYVHQLQGVVHRFGIKLPDRELACAPLSSPEGEAYLAAMRCAANFAFANRQLLTDAARRSFESVLAGKVKNHYLSLVYDITHNIGKVETHLVDGKPRKVCVHRKGATRAFGPGSPVLPPEYQSLGQPVLVPGSMGTASWVLLGTEMSMEKSFGSCCHGAGRVMSRHAAKKSVAGGDLKNQLAKRGIDIRAGSLSGLAEEAPHAYKDVDQVVKSVVASGIARKVARLVPLVVIKG
jgi:tRNA-splicing ligase RtcB (3'-phosphate/5'-hydroxy nucleic acid ligase)